MSDRCSAAPTAAATAAAVLLARRRARVVGLLSSAVIAAYFGFMGLFAFDKPLLGAPLAPGLTLGLVLGPALIVAACLVSLVYVLWANRVFDPSVAALAAQRKGDAS